MIAYVLDASALLRYADDEAGAERVKEILLACVRRKARVRMSALQWGEVAGNLRKRLGAAEQLRILSSLLPSEAEIVPADGDRAVRAASLKVDKKIAYADGFAVDLAMDSSQHLLVTADYGFKVIDDLIRIEFLPPK
jgi:PIN domain nuclease of toxin-antitoxin system